MVSVEKPEDYGTDEQEAEEDLLDDYDLDDLDEDVSIPNAGTVWILYFASLKTTARISTGFTFSLISLLYIVLFCRGFTESRWTSYVVGWGEGSGSVGEC